jgi:ubiquinone/menaquinone biosynthesis C-methylase UbiE
MSNPSVWDRRAATYDRAPGWVERVAIGDSRAWSCASARGRVLEVAIGTGRNLPYYPAGVALTAVDLSPGMLAQARRRAAALGREVDLRVADAERLPFADGSFDTVVCTLAVCSIADRAGALREMYRVLRADGRIVLVDHVERRWWRGRPADLAADAGFRRVERGRLRLGVIERYIGQVGDPRGGRPSAGAS